MKTVLLTTIHQVHVKVLNEKDAPDTYKQNLPPGGSSKWELIEYPDGKRFWHPTHSYTYATPPINDHTKVTIEVKE